MTLAELYQAYRAGGPTGEIARTLLVQTHWFTVHAEFDPRTGEALPQALSTFLSKVAHTEQPGKIYDRLYRITEHARPAVERLFRTLNENPRREHAILHVRAVREIDAGSFIKLSMRPGRTIREKLAGKPYLHAVRCFQSVDLPENRLLKAFVSCLAELLELRQQLLGEPQDELLPQIRSWLLSDEAKSISRWENLPPNNTLLSHRDYRRVWDSWRRLQSLNDDIGKDLSQLDERRKTMEVWENYGRMYHEGTHLFADIPVLFNYDEFTIQTWSDGPLVQRVERRIRRSRGKRTITQAVCVDLTEIHPRYAEPTGGIQALTDTYLWQQWKNENGAVDLELFASDAAYLHPDAITISSSDIFFANDKFPEQLLDRAARSFARRLNEIFKADSFIWLVPDALNDFELEIIRRNLNAYFPDAQPLPRSIAAIFEHIDYTCITNDGYPIVVVDAIGGITCATKVIARFDQDLKERVPETHGYYWERCPPVILCHPDDEEKLFYDMITVDRNGHWREPIRPKTPRSIEPDTLKNNSLIGQFDFLINVFQSPVVGGMRFHTLQERAPGIPLWRDQIPELSIKGWNKGYYRRFSLVSRGTTIKPIRGLVLQIPIEEHFTLPAGKRFYQFPLFQGDSAAEIGYSVRLDSPAFPLKTDKECKLILTFRYGDDEPYTLMFAPLDKSFPPVRATWRRTVEEIVTDAPAPGYPAPFSWSDLKKMPKPDSQETSDLLEWFISAIDRLDRKLFFRPSPRTVGIIRFEWRQDKNEEHFTFVQCAETNSDVFIHQRAFVEGFDFLDFRKGDRVSFELHEEDGRYSGRKIASPNYREEVRLQTLDEEATKKLCEEIRKSLYVPVILIWRDARSITDSQCPKAFAKIAEEKIAYLASLLTLPEIPTPVKNEVMFLLACMHKDTTDECVEWITQQMESGNILDPLAVGFALGDLSELWQQYIFSILISKPNIAIRVMAFALWRQRHFVEQFSVSELKTLLNALLERLRNIHPPRMGKSEKIDEREVHNWARELTQPLELLLGLLRTRESANPHIRMLLQPHQKITKQFAGQIDRLEEIVAESNVTLFSRVQLNIPKPEGVCTPDLLYALRLYLTGDDGANAIHITGVADSDKDEAF
jgi:cold shock CspA family protein